MAFNGGCFARADRRAAGGGFAETTARGGDRFLARQRVVAYSGLERLHPLVEVGEKIAMGRMVASLREQLLPAAAALGKAGRQG